MKTDFNINPESFYQSFDAPDGDFDDSEYCEDCGKHEIECKCFEKKLTDQIEL